MLPVYVSGTKSTVLPLCKNVLKSEDDKKVLTFQMSHIKWIVSKVALLLDFHCILYVAQEK